MLQAVWAEEVGHYDFSECKDLANPGGWDVGYWFHLANHKQGNDQATQEMSAGDGRVLPAFATVPLASGGKTPSASTHKLRIRFISAADMSAYRIDLGELRGTLIATDGQPCVPLDVSMDSGNALWVGVGQRMDVVVEVPNTEARQYVVAPF